MDTEKIKEAVRLFLEGIGEDPDREGLKDTPDRVARMCPEIFRGLTEDPAPYLSRTFESGEKGLVLCKDIEMYSVCEHHLLPFFGKVHIAYYPTGRVVGLSKLVRTVEVFARRPQIQERLTGQIADALMKELNPKGVLVIVQAEHMCMSMRGVNRPGTKTMTIAARGCFEEKEELADRVLGMLQENHR